MCLGSAGCVLDQASKLGRSTAEGVPEVRKFLVNAMLVVRVAVFALACLACSPVILFMFGVDGVRGSIEGRWPDSDRARVASFWVDLLAPSLRGSYWGWSFSSFWFANSSSTGRRASNEDVRFARQAEPSVAAAPRRVGCF